MTPSFRVGRIAGVEIEIHWSVLVIFSLISYALAAGRFPATYPGHASGTYLLAGVASAVVFFLGLLAHEVSHAVLAIHDGVRVEGITLWLFGGVARLKGEARTPSAELRIAGVGPAVSLAIGLFFAAGAAVVSALGYSGLLLGALTWLAAINIALALFNVLPAAPLDGGRLLRAALWRWRGDRAWAAVMAARAGSVLGLLLIISGLWQFLFFGIFGALWLALIGWFLFSAAVEEERQAKLGDALKGVRVGDVMSPNPVVAPADASVEEFIDGFIWTTRHSAFPITENGHPIGLVTLNRVKDVPAASRATTRLREIACPAERVAQAVPGESLVELLPRLNECEDGRALVVTDGRLVGIVSPSDISRTVRRTELRRA